MKVTRARKNHPIGRWVKLWLPDRVNIARARKYYPIEQLAHTDYLLLLRVSKVNKQSGKKILVQILGDFWVIFGDFESLKFNISRTYLRYHKKWPLIFLSHWYLSYAYGVVLELIGWFWNFGWSSYMCERWLNAKIWKLFDFVYSTYSCR